MRSGNDNRGHVASVDDVTSGSDKLTRETGMPGETIAGMSDTQPTNNVESLPLNPTTIHINGKGRQGEQHSGPRPTCGANVLAVIKENALIVLTLLAVVVGICLGLGLREARPSEDVLRWLGLPGELFLRSLKATIVPLVVCMVISCTSRLDPKSNGKIAIVCTLGFLCSQIIAAIIAVCLFFAFTPPVTTDNGGEEVFNTELQTQDVFYDLIRNIFPDNLVSATFTQTTTVYTEKENNIVVMNHTSLNQSYNILQITRHRGKDNVGGTNILGLITVCTAVGIAASRVLKIESEFLSFFRQAQEVVFVIIRWLFWMTPIGVVSLITVSIAGVDDIAHVFYRLGLLVASVVTGLSIYMIVIVPGGLFLFRRTNPFVFLSRCVRPFVIAFAATATSVAMPDMMTSCDLNKLDPKVSGFVVPMSITLHADGSALYITAASLFVAQASGQGLGVENISIIGIMAAILSLAIPPVPSASIVTIVIILTSLSYPLHDVALLFAVEWLLDRLRSGVNAVGHVVVAAITDSICSKSMGVPGPLHPRERELDIENIDSGLTYKEGLYQNNPNDFKLQDANNPKEDHGSTKL